MNRLCLFIAFLSLKCNLGKKTLMNIWRKKIFIVEISSADSCTKISRRLEDRKLEPTNDYDLDFTNNFSGNFVDSNETQPSTNIFKITVNQQSKKMYLKKSAIWKSLSNIKDSKSIAELIKRFKEYPIAILSEKPVKPLIRKLKKDFEQVVARGKLMLRRASKLEKAGKNKNRKEVKKFTKKLKVS